jgi:DNA primase
MSVIDEVKQRNDIVAVIGQYTALQKAGRTLRALCPFHNEKTPSFFVYPDRQSWHCFGACGTGGDVISFVMKIENMEFGEALRLLAERAGVIIPTRVEKDPDKDKKERLFLVNEAAAAFYHSEFLKSPAAEVARQYTAKRGISSLTVSDFQLGFSPNSWGMLIQHLVIKGYTEQEIIDAGLAIVSDDGQKHDRFHGKLMFPIRDERKHVTGFGARVLDGSLPKYVNSPQTPVFDKSGTLYGIDLASSAIRKQELAVIVEGYMDVIIAHQGGFNNVIASMGTAITEKQVSIIKRFSGNVALALDADSAGEEAMLRCVIFENILDSELKVMLLPEGKDPDEVIIGNPGLWKELVNKAIPVLDYTFDKVASTPPTTAHEKTAVARRLLPLVSQIKEPVRRGHYFQKLARLTGTSEPALQVELTRLQSSRTLATAKKDAQMPSHKMSFSDRREELCLALLLRYPDLKEQKECVLPEYFDTSENREIFLAIKQGFSDVASLKDKLDEVVRDYVDGIANINIPEGKIEEKYNDCVLRLRKRYLQNIEMKKAEVLRSESESGGSAAELAKQEEQGMENTSKLLEVTHKISRG